MDLVPGMGSRANTVPAGRSERNSRYVLSVIGELEGWEREQAAAATADGNVPGVNMHVKISHLSVNTTDL